LAKYEVNIDQYCLKCEVISLLDVPPNPEVILSEWDAYGYRELEFRVVSGQVTRTVWPPTPGAMPAWPWPNNILSSLRKPYGG
jgi:hypothetical protein